MKAADLKERATPDLRELREQLKKDLFSYRMRNFTSQLDDTSLIKKTKRDIARINQVLDQRAPEGAAAAEGSES